MSLTTDNLRKMEPEEIINSLVIIKNELLQLRQKKHSSIIKPTEIKAKKQIIARIMTVLHEKKITEIVKKCKEQKVSLPKELLPRKTRKIRLGLSSKQIKSIKNGKQRKIREPLFAYNPLK